VFLGWAKTEKSMAEKGRGIEIAERGVALGRSLKAFHPDFPGSYATPPFIHCSHEARVFISPASFPSRALAPTPPQGRDNNHNFCVESLPRRSFQRWCLGAVPGLESVVRAQDQEAMAGLIVLPLFFGAHLDTAKTILEIAALGASPEAATQAQLLYAFVLLDTLVSLPVAVLTVSGIG
jgi:hypothetical protein